MAIWLVRAGSHGEFEQKFLDDKRVYVTWDGLNTNIAKLADRDALFETMKSTYPGAKQNRLLNWVRQVWPFAHEMRRGDLVIVPLKSEPSIWIGEITGDYQFDAKAQDPYFHWRTVKWVGEGVPRSHFGKDLLFSFGAFLTICRVKRNNAEARILAMWKNKWKPETIDAVTAQVETEDDETGEAIDIEAAARDGIARQILAQFKGHGLARLVEGILKAQGYTTYRSPEGADGGVDILAGMGALGFGSPKLSVEVKSQDTPIDRPTVDKLMGAMSKFGSSEGLFVSWSGFKPNVQKELAQSFFKVRLWSQKELLEALFANYGALDEDLKAELPLKRIWMVAAQDEE